ncbi:hypothetical protein ASG43_01080 [Aureimonas sp. Leaf454]|uniref:phage head closure protein n=1 Tax=Aureimonas sp. Leaf454 TaxID=1736381 RepID=UPI0006FA383A|nr:phage head closure protein [Aureimonas sp. Leaf454]KQT54251.1 hypothetical protein ASG43_01080 [Aureimonas sp. Leaf454]
MALIFLDPGLLRRRVRLQTPDMIADASGGAVTAWREVAELSAHVEPLSAAARERFGQRAETVTHRVICRFRSDIDRGMAFVLKDRRLTIRSLHDPDESGRFLVCRCEEER